MQGFYTILLLVVSNIFMTCAWYGHLKMKQQFSWFEHLPLIGVILFSWFLAFFEYCFQVSYSWLSVRSPLKENRLNGIMRWLAYFWWRQYTWYLRNK